MLRVSLLVSVGLFAAIAVGCATPGVLATNAELEDARRFAAPAGKWRLYVFTHRAVPATEIQAGGQMARLRSGLGRGAFVAFVREPGPVLVEYRLLIGRGVTHRETLQVVGAAGEVVFVAPSPHGLRVEPAAQGRKRILEWPMVATTYVGVTE